MNDRTMRVNQKRAVAVLLILGGLVTAVYGATLFQTTIPAVTVKSAAAMLEGCDPVKAQSEPVESTSGTVVFNCVGVLSPTPAFPAAIRVSTTGSVIATFDLTSSGYVSLGVAPYSTLCSAATPLVSQATTSLPVGDYDYCASYVNAPAAGASFSSFSVSWTTP